MSAEAKYLKSMAEKTSRGVPLDSDEIALLESVVKTNPWFVTGRILLSDARKGQDPVSLLHLGAYPRPLFLLGRYESAQAAGDAKENAAPMERGGLPDIHDTDVAAILDEFLNKGDYRIVPDESSPDLDISAASSSFDPDDDMISEELAEIYLAQGLNEQAARIYRKLSLLNPEKSVYFAELIAKTGTEHD